MNPELNTEMMNLLNRVDVGTIKSAAQFSAALADIAGSYGPEATADSYLEMLRHCGPNAQDKISRLAAQR